MSKELQYEKKFAKILRQNYGKHGNHEKRKIQVLLDISHFHI